MRKDMLNSTTGSLVVALLITCPLLPMSADAMPNQRSVMAASKPVEEPGVRTKEPVKPAKAPVLARNNPAAAGKANRAGGPTATTVKEAKAPEKSTINRCWKRLMSTFREINHAHRNRQN